MNKNEKKPDVTQIIQHTLEMHTIASGGILDQRSIWTDIFIAVFGTNPNDNNDPRWDTLFDARDGYGALAIFADIRSGSHSP